MRLMFCTIATPAFFPMAAVLFESIRAVYGTTCDLALLAISTDKVDVRFDAVKVVQLDEIENPYMWDMALRYSDAELSLAHKPIFVRHLMRNGAAAVVYLDADIEVFSHFIEVEAILAAKPGTIVLTPHSIKPRRFDKWVSDRDLLLWGTFNAGFFAADNSPEALEFLEWWTYCNLTDCYRSDLSPSRDQKWLNLAPVYFKGVRVLGHQGYNVGHFNLDDRRAILLGNELRFFHYTNLSGSEWDANRYLRNIGIEEDATIVALLNRYKDLVADHTARLRVAASEHTGFAHEGFNLSYRTRHPQPQIIASRENALQLAQQISSSEPVIPPDAGAVALNRPTPVAARAVSTAVPGELRVVHVTPKWFSPDSTVGGGERWVDNVALALSAGAPHVRQAMIALGTAPSFELRNNIAFRILANERPSGRDPISSQLWSELVPFDVVHVHQSLTDFGGYASCVAASLRKIVVMTDLGGGNNPVMINDGLSIADGIVSISEYARRSLNASKSIPHIALIGPVDTDAFRPAVERVPGRAAICVSRIMPHKGIDRLIRALPNGMKLRVVGHVYHGVYRDLLVELARGKDVEFIYDASDAQLLDLYQRSSLFLQASCFVDIYGTVQPKTELMGLTTLEAMACGLPVAVSSDGGSLPELVTDPRFGRVFRTHDELCNILRDHQSGSWPKLGAGGFARDYVVKNCSLSAYGRKLGSFYSAIARKKSAA